MSTRAVGHPQSTTFSGADHNMWTTTIDRRGFVDFLEDETAKRFHIERRDVIDSVSPGAITLVWKTDPRENYELPVLAIVAASDRQELLAWSMTYVGPLRPLTAFVRVVTPDELAPYVSPSPSPRLGQARDACIGLVLGEILFLTAGRIYPDGATVHACMGTHSFVMARAAALSQNLRWRPDVSDAWAEARRLTRQREFDLSLLRAPWQVLDQVGLGPQPNAKHRTTAEQSMIAGACEQIARQGAVSGSAWDEVLKSLMPGHENLDTIRSSRETRVAVVEAALHQLRHPSLLGEHLSAFVGGYLLSQIAPGTLDHAHLIADVDAMPTFLWYGLCAGLHPRFRSNTATRQHLIREFHRDVSIFDYPYCDIALPELRVAAQGVGQVLSLSGGPLSVELSPGVTTFLPRPHSRQGPTMVREGGQGELFDQKQRESSPEPHKPPRKRTRRPKT